jgi:hypothetical protein
MQAPEAPLTSARNCKCKFPLENLSAEFDPSAKGGPYVDMDFNRWNT